MILIGRTIQKELQRLQKKPSPLLKNVSKFPWGFLHFLALSGVSEVSELQTALRRHGSKWLSLFPMSFSVCLQCTRLVLVNFCPVLSEFTQNLLNSLKIGQKLTKTCSVQWLLVCIVVNVCNAIHPRSLLTCFLLVILGLI